jgi:hypothetical protein
VLYDFLNWLQFDLGRTSEDGQSWSQALNSSKNLWPMFEGTHVLTLMFFAGTIWIIDLRMMGIAFRNTPFSKLNDRVLPITMAAFGMMVFTGLVTMFGRQPATFFYHDMWFRLKMIFLLIAVINIFWFHYMVQKSQVEWDAAPNPPMKVKISGALSMSCWILIIIFGRFIAYDWYKCDKVERGSFLYAFQECDLLYRDLDLDAMEEEERLLLEQEDEDPLKSGGSNPFAAPPENQLGEPAPAPSDVFPDARPPGPDGAAEPAAPTPGQE